MEERLNNPAARLYRSMYLIRRVEEEIIRLYPTDKIKSPVHLSIGQEAVSAAVCDHLDKRDYVFGTYRGHALYLAKGGDVPRMMAELYGKADGCARGKAGSMHLVDPEVGMMGTSAVVATGISNAVGAALALHARVGVAIEAVRRGRGPRFLECMTYRWRDHVGPTEDRQHQYRPDAELDQKIAADNLAGVGRLLPAETRASIEAAEEKRIAAAIAFAEASEFPADREVFDHVFTN
jgi:TPP-dependent pyruvate/acetoin dehydrogenase alpha subunit